VGVCPFYYAWKIFWSRTPVPPEAGVPARHFGPTKSKAGRIQLSSASKGYVQSFEAQWASVFYELLNIESTSEFARANGLAASARYTKEQYVAEIVRIERGAAVRLGKLYREVWLPWCVTVGFKSDEKKWPPMDDVPLEEYIQKARPRSIGYFQGIEAAYDYVVDPKRRDQFAKGYTGLESSAPSSIEVK
jgi:hypothetical protein